MVILRDITFEQANIDIKSMLLKLLEANLAEATTTGNYKENSIKKKTSSDADGIPFGVFNKCSFESCVRVAYLLTMSFNLGQIFDQYHM